MSHFPTRMAICACLLCATVSTAAAQDATVQASSGLRLRSEPSTSSSILTTMADGTPVHVMAEVADGWYQISYKDYVGYSYGKYLDILPEATPEVAPEVTPAPEVTEPQTEKATPLSIRVIEGPLNIRSGPGTSYDKVGSLTVGSTAVTSGKTGDWYQIDAGYVHGDYVMEFDPATQAESAQLGQQIADYALTFVGCRYSYGGNGPTKFDCSGLVKYVMNNFGITVNRTASAQLDNGTPVSKAELQPGDAVYFRSAGYSSAASHTGIYIGDGKFVHAADYDSGVKVSELDSSYFSKIYIGARRMA